MARRRATTSLLFWVTFWPGATLAGAGGAGGLAARREPGARFLLAWLVPSWIVFELGRDQAAALRAAALSGDRDPDRRRRRERGAVARRRWLVRGAAGWFVLPLRWSAIGVVVLIVIVGRAARPARLAVRRRRRRSSACSPGGFYDVDGAERSLLRGDGGVGAARRSRSSRVTFPLAAGAVSERADRATMLRDSGCTRADASPPPAITKSRAWCSSLGTDTRLTDGAGAAEFLRGGACRFALVEARQRAQLRAARRRDRTALCGRPARRRLSTSASGGRSTIAVYPLAEKP